MNILTFWRAPCTGIHSPLYCEYLSNVLRSRHSVSRHPSSSFYQRIWSIGCQKSRWPCRRKVTFCHISSRSISVYLWILDACSPLHGGRWVLYWPNFCNWKCSCHSRPKYLHELCHFRQSTTWPCLLSKQKFIKFIASSEYWCLETYTGEFQNRFTLYRLRYTPPSRAHM